MQITHLLRIIYIQNSSASAYYGILHFLHFFCSLSLPAASQLTLAECNTHGVRIHKCNTWEHMSCFQSLQFHYRPSQYAFGTHDPLPISTCIAVHGHNYSYSYTQQTRTREDTDVSAETLEATGTPAVFHQG